MPLPIKNLLERNASHIAVFLTVVTGVLSFITVPVDGVSFSFSDKLLHFVAYFFLMTTWLYSIASDKDFQRRTKFVFLGCFIYGITIEFSQDVITSHRTGSFSDILANSVGIALATVVFHLFKKKIFFNK